MVAKQVKKLIPMVLVLLMTCSSVLFAQGNDYTGHWAEDSIRNWVDKGYIKGYADGTFKPENNITRAEFMAVVNRSFGFKEEAAVSYKDVQESHWAYNEFKVASAAGYIAGFEDGTLRPNEEITRQEMAAVVARLLNLNEAKDSQSFLGLGDVKQIPEWSAGVVSAIVDKGYINLRDGNLFAPTMPATRAEVIAVLDKSSGGSQKSDEIQKATEEKAQQSFNTLPVFVDKNGKELTTGDLSIPETGENDFPYLSQKKTRTKNQEGLDKYGYVEKEYFLKGTANVYGLTDDKQATTIVQENVPYVNRVIVYMPEDPADFKGIVYTDILNSSSKVDLPDLWRRGYEYYMKKGFAYVGITSKDINVGALKRFNPERYNVLNWNLPGTEVAEDGLAWDIFGQVGALLKENEGASRLLYGEDSKVDRAYLIGQSRSGFYLNTFNNSFGAANYEIGTDKPLYDGMMNVVGVFMNTDLSTDHKSIDGLKASAVPYIVFVGENDYREPPARSNSNTDTDKYRYYVLAGGAHSSKIFPPDPLDEIQKKVGRDAGYYLGFNPDAENGLPHTNTDLDMDVYYNGALKILDDWVVTGKDPLPGTTPDTSKRDKYGNMTGGIRSPQITVPVATYTGWANGKFSTGGASMVYLTQEQISERYPNGKTQYLAEYEAAVDKAIKDGWIVEEDRARIMVYSTRQARVVFDHETYDQEFIEKIMTADLSVKKSGKTVTVSGPANVYGVLKDDLIYVKKGNLPEGQIKHTTQVDVNVPTDYDGTVIIDLVAKNTAPSAVSSKAAVITIDLDQTWELPHLDNAYRQTDGFLWDIISQIANSVKNNHAAWGLTSEARTVKLAGDANSILTYEDVFSNFAKAYNLSPTDVDLDGAEASGLAKIYNAVDTIEEELTDTTKPITR